MSDVEPTDPVWNDEDLESICRHYCKAMGLDPDKEIGTAAPISADGFQPATLLVMPLWMAIRDRAKSAVAWHYAITMRAAEVEIQQQLLASLGIRG